MKVVLHFDKKEVKERVTEIKVRKTGRKKEEHFVRQTLPACMRKALSALV